MVSECDGQRIRTHTRNSCFTEETFRPKEFGPKSAMEVGSPVLSSLLAEDPR